MKPEILDLIIKIVFLVFVFSILCGAAYALYLIFFPPVQKINTEVNWWKNTYDDIRPIQLRFNEKFTLKEDEEVYGVIHTGKSNLNFRINMDK